MIEGEEDIKDEFLNNENILEFRDFLQKFKCMSINNDINEKNNTIKNNFKINYIAYNIIYPKSSSLFRKKHHRKMNIIIKSVTNKEYIINIKSDYSKNKILDEILDYYKTLTRNTTEKQCDRYINKINEIIKNTKKKKSYESIVDDFVRILFEIFDFDDGKKLKMQSQDKLYLKIGSEKVPSIPDLICKTNNDIIWMVEESKHINNSTYLEGDLQLICHLFSAFQYNNKKKEIEGIGIIPKTLFGFKIKNTKCFFYRIDMSDDYMKCLINNNFDKNITVYKYPEKGIDINPYDINSYNNIREVFNILYNLKLYTYKYFYLDESNF
jgi:hypothetical protein